MWYYVLRIWCIASVDFEVEMQDNVDDPQSLFAKLECLQYRVGQEQRPFVE